jgi:protein-tyrosine-phosphatase
MAEYALRSLLDRERPNLTKVVSAGTFGAGGHPATMFAQEAAKTWDLSLRPHRSQPLTEDLVNEADLILAMAPEHHNYVTDLVPKATGRTFLLKSFPDNSPVGEKVEDPIGMDLEDYNSTFLEIGEYLGKHLPEIVRRVDAKLNA